MDRHLLEILSPVFNDPHVERAVKEYVEYRINQLHKDIEREDSHVMVARLQGRISELRGMLDLRVRINDKIRELR